MLQERHRIRNTSDTQFTWFLTPSATEWAREWVSEKISIPGNNMIHCTVIRDSARWKEKIRSLTWVTHREAQILSKCHQAHCSCRALCENVQTEFIIFIYFHLIAIITLSKDCDALKKRNWKAKVKSRSRAQRPIFFFFFPPPLPPLLAQEMISGTKRADFPDDQIGQSLYYIWRSGGLKTICCFISLPRTWWLKLSEHRSVITAGCQQFITQVPWAPAQRPGVIAHSLVPGLQVQTRMHQKMHTKSRRARRLKDAGVSVTVHYLSVLRDNTGPLRYVL